MNIWNYRRTLSLSLSLYLIFLVSFYFGQIEAGVRNCFGHKGSRDNCQDIEIVQKTRLTWNCISTMAFYMYCAPCQIIYSFGYFSLENVTKKTNPSTKCAKRMEGQQKMSHRNPPKWITYDKTNVTTLSLNLVWCLIMWNALAHRKCGWKMWLHEQTESASVCGM